MKVIDNINQKLRDDLALEIKQGSKVTIAASCFSIYAYQELKKQLENIKELRFIFTSPTFISESFPKEKKEFFANFKKTRDERNQKIYNHTKSKTEAEYRALKYQESLEQ